LQTGLKLVSVARSRHRINLMSLISVSFYLSCLSFTVYELHHSNRPEVALVTRWCHRPNLTSSFRSWAMVCCIDSYDFSSIFLNVYELNQSENRSEVALAARWRHRPNLTLLCGSQLLASCYCYTDNYGPSPTV
jgi:hypothetical protein